MMNCEPLRAAYIHILVHPYKEPSYTISVTPDNTSTPLNDGSHSSVSYFLIMMETLLSIVNKAIHVH